MLSATVTRLAPTSRRPVISDVAARTCGLRRELTGSGVAGFALLGLFGRFVVPGVVGQQRDTGAFYYPLTAWLSQELAAGRFPLWCPLIFAGYPLVADGEIGLLYPPNVLALLLLPVDVAFILVRSGHYLLAAAGLYALGRVLGIGRSGSTFGGVAFALGGFMFGHLDHGNIVRSAAWLPLTLCCADLALRAVGRRRGLWLALGAGTVTLAGLGLHPQILLIDLVALGLFVGARALALVDWQRQPGLCARSLARSSGTGVLVVATIAVVGLLGAAVQLVPTYELGAVSSRGDGLTYAQSAAGGVAFVDLLTMLLPYGFRADPAVQWMRYPYWESTLYVGVVGVLLAGIGLLSGRWRVVLPVAAVGAVGLLLAMAQNAPVDLYAVLWSLPGYSAMRAPVRYALIFELSLALLAAAGLDALRRGVAPRGARTVSLAVAGAVLATLAGAVALREWLLADPQAAVVTIEQTYLTLPRDRPQLTAQAVRDGLLGTLQLGNSWTMLALVSAVGTAALVLVWGWRRRGSGRLAGAVAAIGVAELLLVAHGFHPTVSREKLGEESRAMQFIGQQTGQWRTFLAGRSDLSITSRPALLGVAQAYGYSSLPTTRMERYWTRVNEVDDDLLDLWNVRYVVESRAGQARGQLHAVYFDPARPLIDGPAGSPLGEETFQIDATRGDAIRLLGSLRDAGAIPDGEPVAEIVVSGPGAPPTTLTVRAGDHLAEAAYDEATAPLAHRKATVGMRWEPRDPAGTVYPRDVYLADLPLPAPTTVERIEVRTLARHGALRLAGLGVFDRQANVVRSVFPSQRARYAVAYESETTVVLENRTVQPRAFLASRAVVIPPDDWSLTRLTDTSFDPRTTVLLERPLATPDDGGTVLDGAPVGAEEQSEIVRYEPNVVVVRVRAAETRYLVLTDSYFPGWSVWIDGRPAEVERADYLFRAVEVPPGEHVVEWRYQPASLLLGAAISAIGLAVMAALALRGLAVHRVWSTAPVTTRLALAPARPGAAARAS
jgi:hypothetical protein